MKTLALKTETVRVLSSDELDLVEGGVHKTSSAHKPKTVSSALEPTSTVQTISSMFQPTSTARHPRPVKTSSVRPTGTAVTRL